MEETCGVTLTVKETTQSEEGGEEPTGKTLYYGAPPVADFTEAKLGDEDFAVIPTLDGNLSVCFGSDYAAGLLCAELSADLAAEDLPLPLVRRSPKSLTYTRTLRSGAATS